MNASMPSDYSSLTPQPLGTHRRPSFGSRHPLLALVLCVVIWYALARVWQFSQAYTLRIKGEQALRAYNRRQTWLFPAAGILTLLVLVSAPFADPVTMNAGEYICGFSFLLDLPVLLIAAVPVLVRAAREIAWRSSAR